MQNKVFFKIHACYLESSLHRLHSFSNEMKNLTTFAKHENTFRTAFLNRNLRELNNGLAIPQNDEFQFKNLKI